MNISKKWRTAAAGVIAIALVGGGAVSASAAEGDIINPQSNGSIGSFYIWDGNTGEFADGDPTRSYARNAGLIIAGSATDVLAEIPVPAAAAGFDQVYRFVAKSTELSGGTNTWRAYSSSAASGPNGGLLTDDFQLDSKLSGNNGGIDTVFTEGGDWYVGVAFTQNNGVTPLASIYRTIHVNAATDTWTVDAVEVEGPPAGPTPPVEADLTAGLQNTGLVTETIDSKTLAINAGVAAANQTLTYGSFPAGLTGTVPLDTNGVGTINAAAIPVNQATKLWFSQSDYTGLTWDSFTFTTSQTVNDTTDLSVEVTSSGKFSIVAPAAQLIDLGDVRRNRVTTPVALGAVQVFDDRDVLSGWNLNITSSAFSGPGATTVAATALGYAPVGTTLFSGITAGAPKLAGEGTFGVLATADAGSATGEFEPVVIDTNLTFKAPINAAKGVHTAVLTLDLVSK